MVYISYVFGGINTTFINKTCLVIFILLAIVVMPVNASVSIYNVPVITDDKILPSSEIGYGESSGIQLHTAADVYTQFSFVVVADRNCTLTFVPTQLHGERGNEISEDNVDIRYVKCWYQGGYTTDTDRVGRYLTPELLLHDDAIVYVENDDFGYHDVSNPVGYNYVRGSNGSYVNVSAVGETLAATRLPLSVFSVSDDYVLCPLSLQKNYNKQIWAKVFIPRDQPSDNYTGSINIYENGVYVNRLPVSVYVHDFNLLQPDIEYSVYYRGTVRSPTISSEDKSDVAYISELDDMIEHGITNPTVYKPVNDSVFRRMLEYRQSGGMNNTNIYYTGLNIQNGSQIQHYKDLAENTGVENLYVYGVDERSLGSSENRAYINETHSYGGKVFCAQLFDQPTEVPDILDLCVATYLNTDYAAMYHANGNRIFSYNNPQVVGEYPRTFRLNYGLKLWQADYDGSMDYAYQHGFGNIWNDFDYSTRDHVFAYPTETGVVDTIQFEGFSEGVTDVRYLTTLVKTIESAKANGYDVYEMELYVNTLRTNDLSNESLDSTRLDIIYRIDDLQRMIGGAEDENLDTSARGDLFRSCIVLIGLAVISIFTITLTRVLRGDYVSMAYIAKSLIGLIIITVVIMIGSGVMDIFVDMYY